MQRGCESGKSGEVGRGLLTAHCKPGGGRGFGSKDSGEDETKKGTNRDFLFTFYKRSSWMICGEWNLMGQRGRLWSP